MRLLQAEEIEDLLRQIPHMVDLLDEGDPTFFDSVRSWLRSLEGALLANQSTITSQISILRGGLVGIARGQSPPGVEFTRRPSRRQLREAGAMEGLRKAESLVSHQLGPQRESIAEASRLMGQLVGVAQQKGLLGSTAGGATGSDLASLWSMMAAEPELGPAVGRVTALVGQVDALILLSRALPANIS